MVKKKKKKKKLLLIITAIYKFITEENLRSLFFTFVNDISLPITTLIAFMITQTLPYWFLTLIIWYFSVLYNLILLYHLCPLCLPYFLAKTDVKLNVFKYNLYRKTSMKKYTRLLFPWNSPGKNTGMDCHFLLQGSFRPRNQTQISCIVGRFFTIWATREALYDRVDLKYNEAKHHIIHLLLCNLSLFWQFIFSSK